jgi:hypothetical protein
MRLGPTGRQSQLVGGRPMTDLRPRRSTSVRPAREAKSHRAGVERGTVGPKLVSWSAALMIMAMVPACGHSGNPSSVASTITAGPTASVPTSTRTPVPARAGTSTVPFRLQPLLSALSCSAAVQTGDAQTVVSAFRAARIRGQGAEGCLTQEALRVYCDRCGPDMFHGPNAPSPGPICLYSCDGKRVGAIEVEGLQDRSNSTPLVTLLVAVHEPVDSGAFIDNEQITLGRGVPVSGSRPVPLLVVGATTGL